MKNTSSNHYHSSLSFSMVFLAALLIGACSKGSENEQAEARVAPVTEAPIAESTMAADSIYLNGKIYTVDADNSWVDAMAIRDGKILATGSNADIAALKGPATKVTDLKGGMVMPGIHDMHAHPMQAGETHHYQCAFPFSYSMEQIIERIKSCAGETPKGEWIRGGQWANELLATANPPNKKILDEITTEHPVYLGDSTVHDAWLNSKALEVLGIDKDTPDPDGGVIDHDSDGEPSGILHDNAAYVVMRQIPHYSAEQYEDALQWAMTEMNTVGVTAVKDALADVYALRAYKALDSKGELTMRVATSLGWKASWTETHENEMENIENRAQYASARINTGFAKIFLDGIPPTRTAAMLDPYVPDEKHGDSYLGKLIHTPGQLAEDVTWLDAQGLTVKIHATGDRSLRVALDAFEAARKANGDSGLRHEVSHAELVNPDDIPRFRALNVVAELSPIMWYPSPLMDYVASVIGTARANQFFPIKSLLESGALLIYGSDWPSVVPDPNPWPGVEAMVTRRNPYTNTGEPLWAEQAIDLASAIRIFTINGATAAKLGDTTGSLEVGKSADFIVLDRNIFDVPIEDISDTSVLQTVIAGKAVYGHD